MSQNKQPFFSICIPNYNYAHHIGETIESVLKQDFEDFEIIVVDNRSTDDSVAVIRSYEDARIRFYENNYNIGFAPNLQRVTQYATGRYLNLLSSDDLMAPGTLKRLSEVIQQEEEERDLLFLYSDVTIVDANSEVVGLITAANSDMQTAHHWGKSWLSIWDERKVYTKSGLEAFKTSYPKLRTIGPFCSIVYSKKLWEQIEGYNATRTIGPDKFFNFKALSIDPKVVYVQEPLFAYREHRSPNKIAHSKNIKKEIDNYLNTLEYSEGKLAQLGLAKNSVIQYLIDHYYVLKGLRELASFRLFPALKMYGMALATYPEVALSRLRFYLLATCILLFPISMPSLWLSHRLKAILRNSTK